MGQLYAYVANKYVLRACLHGGNPLKWGKKMTLLYM